MEVFGAGTLIVEPHQQINGALHVGDEDPIEVNNRALPEGLAGMALGFVLFSVVMGILWAVGVYRFAGKGIGDHLEKGFVLAVLAGILEEILFRGLLFRLSAKIFG